MAQPPILSNPFMTGANPVTNNAFTVGQPMNDLGMGADLQAQVQAQLLERRKRAMLAAGQQPADFGALAMGTGVTGQGNTGGYALQALMGRGVAGG